MLSGASVDSLKEAELLTWPPETAGVKLYALFVKSQLTGLYPELGGDEFRYVAVSTHPSSPLAIVHGASVAARN